MWRKMAKFCQIWSHGAKSSNQSPYEKPQQGNKVTSSKVVELPLSIAAERPRATARVHEPTTSDLTVVRSSNVSESCNH